MVIMAHTKDKHYWVQLRTALTGGLWDAKFPGREPNADPLDWSNLLRKFNKHCTGFADVAEVASQTQALSVLLSSVNKDRSLDVDGNINDQDDTLSLGQECILLEERSTEAEQGYNTLKNLTGSNIESIKLAVAYYAYALGHPSECMSVLAEAKDITDIHSRIPTSGSVRSQLSIPPGGAHSSSSSWTGSFTAVGSIMLFPDISEGKAWALTECMRSSCLLGMSHERISPEDPQTALYAYMTALPLFRVIATDISCTLPAQSLADPGSFARYRELWRWTERLLRRAIILASHVLDLGQQPTVLTSSATELPDPSVWALFGHYRTCSAHWPPTFRPGHRSTVLALHLRAMILRARALPPDMIKAKAPKWIGVARSVIHEYRSILNVSTSFPRAGERNFMVEDFVDLCVAAWEADGATSEQAGWITDVLWWATRLTFKSVRIFRHMSRLLSVSGDAELAKRTLRLYVQIVSKAWEALRAEPAEPRRSEESAFEVDSDRHWTSTLVFGARMLCRLALQEPDYKAALDMATEAGAMIEKAKTRLDADDIELVASVGLAEGIWGTVMAYTEQDPLTRTARLTESFDMLIASVETYPTPSAQHHLALALSRPGPSQNLQTAIEHARASVEGDPSEIRHWHLLGLLLAMTGDWTAAKGVLEFGADVGEEDTEEENGNIAALPGSPRLNIRDFAENGVEHQVNGHVNGVGTSPPPEQVLLGTILEPGATRIPPPESLLSAGSDRPQSSRHERFEHALQVRMTQLALAEFVSGAEGVSEKWLDVFRWFREKRGVSVDDHRMSIDSRRRSTDTRPLSEIVSIQEPPPGIPEPITIEPFPTSPANDHTSQELPTPIPITVTPASPGVHQPSFGHDTDATPRDQERRSTSLDDDSGGLSRGKRVKQVLKTRVREGQATFNTISKKIGHGVGRRPSIKRNSSAPDFHSVLSHPPSQASSIHLRQYQSIHASQQDLRLLEAPPPPPSPSPTPPQDHNTRGAKDRRLLSDLWLMSAAIFRRLGKIEQARAAIQEAEVRDEDNPAVWVQLGLYYTALSERRRATEALQKALFISPNDVSATIHLCRLYLDQSSSRTSFPPSSPTQPTGSEQRTQTDQDNIDLAVGLLSDLTKGPGWDVAEAWYFLAKGYKLQGRRNLERDCLSFALTLSETRGVRDVGAAVGWCL